MDYCVSVELVDGWCPARQEPVVVTAHFDVTVQDGSFSHDKPEGTVERVSDYQITNVYFVFYRDGRRFSFDHSSGHTFMIDIDEDSFELAKEYGVIEAINQFEGRD